MAPRFCHRCGTPAQPDAAHCTECGEVLHGGPPPGTGAPGAAPAAYPYPAYPSPAPTPASPYPPYTYPYAPYPYPSPQEVEHRKQVNHTKSGLLMMAVGFLIAWVPYLASLGGLLLLIGGVLVITGRRAFGGRHAVLVVAGAALVFLGLVAGGVLAGWFATALLTEPFDRVVPGFLAGVLAVTALVALAVVLFLHGLADGLGRLLLYAALLLAVVVPALVIGTYLGSGLQLLSELETDLDLANGPANVLFAIAAFRSWSRINRGEVPG